MGAYRLSLITPAAANGAAYAVIRSAATGPGSRPRIRQIGLVATQAVASSVGLLRVTSANYGTASTSTLLQALAGTDPASVTNVDTVWSVAPSLPGTVNYIERATIAGVIGNGVILPFPDPLVLEPNTALLVWNPGGSGGSALQLSVIADE